MVRVEAWAGEEWSGGVLYAGVGGVVGVRLLPPRRLVPVNVALSHGHRLAATLARVAQGD